MTCLTLTIDVAREAVSQKADLVVTHHPLPFRPVNRITEETPTGAILVELVTAGIGVWSGHTAWDSAAHGINAMLAESLSLQDAAPLEPDERDPSVGFGRMGTASSHDTVDAVTQRLISTLGCPGCSVAGDPSRPAGRIGIVCGSGGDTASRATSMVSVRQVMTRCMTGLLVATSRPTLSQSAASLSGARSSSEAMTSAGFVIPSMIHRPSIRNRIRE